MATKKKRTRLTEEKNLITGLEKHLGPQGSLLVNGAKRTMREIVGTLRGRIAATTKVAVARDAVQRAVAEERTVLAATDAFVAHLRRAILVAFGSGSKALADCGIAPPKKRRALKTVEKVQAAAKGKATRKLRGTMGRRQREKIKADGKVSVVVTPPPVNGEPSGEGTGRSE
jgi:hypothetical protein